MRAELSQEVVRAEPQEQPSLRLRQVVFAVQGQEEREAGQVLQVLRVFQGRLPQEQASRVLQGVLP